MVICSWVGGNGRSYSSSNSNNKLEYGKSPQLARHCERYLTYYLGLARQFTENDMQTHVTVHDLEFVISINHFANNKMFYVSDSF